MNDLPWIKYKPSVMFIDLIGLSAWAKVAHVALFNYTLINDGPPLNENEALRDITGCPASDWGRVKRELIGKGWVETPKFFLHRGTIKTLNESKETFVGNQNQTATANRKTTRLTLLPPDPESGVVTYCETPSVTHDVTPHVTPGQRQVQKQPQEQKESPPYKPPMEMGSGEKPFTGECREIPTEDEAVTRCMTAGIDDKFIRHVYRTWASQNGKNANGIIVEFVMHCTNRWKNEQKEWRSGTHRGNRKTSGPNNPRLSGQSNDVDAKRASVLAAIAASEDEA